MKATVEGLGFSSFWGAPAALGFVPTVLWSLPPLGMAFSVLPSLLLSISREDTTLDLGPTLAQGDIHFHPEPITSVQTLFSGSHSVASDVGWEDNRKPSSLPWDAAGPSASVLPACNIPSLLPPILLLLSA